MNLRVMNKDLSNTKTSFSNIPTRILAEMALMTALSFELYLMRLYTLPLGGEITLGAMIPVMLFSLRRGAKLGILSGAILGLIVLTVEPFVYHPVQGLLDYPLAFGALGLAGLFRKNPTIGVGIAIGGRFLAHFLSGIIFFASYAPEGLHPALYSAMYNGSFLGIEFIISGTLIYYLLKRNIFKIYL